MLAETGHGWRPISWCTEEAGCCPDHARSPGRGRAEDRKSVLAEVPGTIAMA